MYYDLFQKYQTDYRAQDILSGREMESVRARARAARFDERISLLGLLLDAVDRETGEVVDTEAYLQEVLDVLRQARVSLRCSGSDGGEILKGHIQKLLHSAADAESASGVPTTESLRLRSAAEVLEGYAAMLGVKESGSAAFDLWRKDFESRSADLRAKAAGAGNQLQQLFRFCEAVFPDGQELIVLVTELTIRPHTARFIARYGCEGYYRNSQKLQFHQRGQKLLEKAMELEKLGE